MSLWKKRQEKKKREERERAQRSEYIGEKEKEMAEAFGTWVPEAAGKITKSVDTKLAKDEWELDSDEGALSEMHIRGKGTNDKEMIAAGAAMSMIKEGNRILEKSVKTATTKEKARAGELAQEMREIQAIVPDEYEKEFDSLIRKLNYYYLSG
jgi:uncharacterized protein YbcI